MTQPNHKERQDYIDSVIKTFQKLILEAKTPQSKLKHTLGREFYLTTESAIWDLNYTDKYGTHLPKSEFLLIFTEALADALVPVVLGGVKPQTSWEDVTKTLASLFGLRLLKGIRASNGLREHLTEEDMKILLEIFTSDDTNRSKSKPTP